MTSSTPSIVSYRRHPSPEPSIFFFELEPTSSLSSQQTLSTDNATLFTPFVSDGDWHHLKSNLKMPAAQFAHGPCRAPRMLTPPPQRILAAGGRPSYTISCNSAPGTHLDGDDSAASKMRLHIQLNQTAALLAKVRDNILIACYRWTSD